MGRRTHLSLLGLLSVGFLVKPSLSSAQSSPTSTLVGGEMVPFCGAQNAVAVGETCSGAMVHPRVVVYAAHCGTDISTISTEVEEREVQHCEAIDDHDIYGRDIAYCLLESPLTSARLATPYSPCEGGLREGDEVFIRKTERDWGAETLVSALIEDPGEDFRVGADGVGACRGSSGSPVYAEFTDSAGNESERLIGVLSAGPEGCGVGPIYVSWLHPQLAWIEQRTHLDITPCTDGLGGWSPNPDCLAAKAPQPQSEQGESWCLLSDSETAWAGCGEPVDLGAPLWLEPLAIVGLEVQGEQRASAPFYVEIDVVGEAQEATIEILEPGMVTPLLSTTQSLSLGESFGPFRLDEGEYELKATVLGFHGQRVDDSTQLLVDANDSHGSDGSPSCGFSSPKPHKPGQALVWIVPLALFLARRLKTAC